MLRGLTAVLSIVELFVVAGILISAFDAGRLNLAWLGVGAVTAFINWQAPLLTASTLWLGPVFLIAMLVMMALVAVGFWYYHDQDRPIKPFFMAILVLIPMTLTAKSASWMAYYALRARWVINLPVVVVILVVVFMFGDMVRYWIQGK